VRNARWSILVFASCVALITGALVWLTVQAVGLERREAEARADAKFQEAIRLALWRMESTLAPIIARESSRPYFQYRSFYPADRAYNAMRTVAAPSEIVVPSPLLQGPQDPILLHFEQDAAGACSSPQVPGPQFVALAESTYASKYDLEIWKQRLTDFSNLQGGNRASNAKTTGSDAPAPEAKAVVPQAADGETEVGMVAADGMREQTQSRNLSSAQVAQSASEYNARQNVNRVASEPPQVYDNLSKAGLAVPPAPASKAEAESFAAASAATPDNKKQSPDAGATPPEVSKPDAPLALRDERAADLLQKAENDANLKDRSAGESSSVLSETPPVDATRTDGPIETPTATADDTVVVQGELVARWIEVEGKPPSLVLARDVMIGSSTIKQGVWLDWPRLQESLLAAAGDVLPGASLQPVDPLLTDPLTLGRRLAAIPAELVVPTPPSPIMPAWSPVRTTLTGAWAIALIAAIAIGLVLRASWDLAERRGRFVTAVTHELRTPLTTFCLYSQMLADGMVPDEARRHEYFSTLRTESLRLSRIVESVLDYARLGRRKPSGTALPVPVGELVDQLVGTLAARCEQAQMTLVVQRDPKSDAAIATDPATVERILYNLVDNACKYAASSPDRRIHFDIRVGSKDVEMAVRDHGPGVDAPERATIFRPFVRGRRHGDGSISGLGLGLALAKGLADQLGGELALDVKPDGGGAAFMLRLPLTT